MLDSEFKSQHSKTVSQQPFIVDRPATRLLLSEVPRAAIEAFGLISPKWRKQLAQAPKGAGQPVLTIPGFGGADGCMAMMRNFLTDTGYTAHPWKLGRNIPDSKITKMEDVLEYCYMRESQLVDRISEIADASGEKVSLIGWSMGGVFANAIAQTHSDLIKQVITLGAPVGNPKNTSVWDLLKFINGSTTENEDEYIDEWMRRRNRLTSVSRSVRSSLIYSDMDGAVSKEAAVIEDDTHVENIKMHVSHVGFSHNPLVYWVIAERLAQAIDSWENFDVSMQPGTIQQYFHSSHD